MDHLIETGVDKLVGLVKKNKKISIANAAKALNVSADVIEEWADFLEEEGLIQVEYKLTTPYLIERDMNTAEVEKKANEFVEKKEGFVRNAETTVSKLQLDSEAIKRMKNEFGKLKNDLENEVKTMKTDLGELEKYESMKGSIDTQINQAKEEYSKKIDELNKKILKEKDRYSEIIEEIGKEKEVITKKRKKLEELNEMEEQLLKSLEEFKNTTDDIRDKIKTEKKDLENSEEHLDRLEKVSDEIETNIHGKIASVSEIVARNEETKKKIIEIQQSIIDKAKDYQKSAEAKGVDAKNSAKKFEEFFKKKIQAEEMIKSVQMDGQMLERELVFLIKKAKAFELSPNSRKMGIHVKELKSRFENVEKKKGKYMDEMKKLVNLFK